MGRGSRYSASWTRSIVSDALVLFSNIGTLRVMSRDYCYRCRRPADSCLCPTEAPLAVRTKIVLLMHEKEWRRQKCATGRLACLNLKDAEIIPGLAFDDVPRVRQLLDDPSNACMLLYPGEDALDLSAATFPSEALRDRRLVVFLIDATWQCSRAVLRASPGLLELPRLKFTPRDKSRWIIKKQPADWCLSTIEAIHELLMALESAGLDSYQDKERLLAVFTAMQDYQVMRATRTPNPRHR
ncbi:MAG: DTW domain-containing protein [Spirochaetales bacterium]|nr:MAG: DTW domain-containing protein [Spirochaetales bacterium]